MHHIAVLPGDGIGPEITREAVKVLKVVGRYHHLDLAFSHHLIGGASIDARGDALSKEVVLHASKVTRSFSARWAAPNGTTSTWQTGRINPLFV